MAKKSIKLDELLSLSLLQFDQLDINLVWTSNSSDDIPYNASHHPYVTNS